MKTESSELKDHSGEVRAGSYPSPMKKGHSELIVHLRQMVNNPTFSDVVFLCNDGKRVQAQRMLLAGRSEVLRSLLVNGMAETKLSEIELHGISSRSFLSVVEFLYTADLLDYRPENWTIACELILASRFFVLPTLENIISTSMHDEIFRVAAYEANFQAMAATMLTEIVGTGLCDKKNGYSTELVTIVSSNGFDIVHLQNLSEDAFHYMLANSKCDCEYDSRLSIREFKRFLKVIIWWFYKSDLGSYAKESLQDFFTAETMRALSLYGDLDDVERGESPPNEAPKYFNSFALYLALSQLQGSPKDSLMRLLSNIDFRRIHPILLAKVVEPLNLVPVAEILSSFQFHALRRRVVLSSGSEFVWDHDESFRLLESGRVIQRAASKIGLAVLQTSVSTPGAKAMRWTFTLEEVCEDFVELGLFYYLGRVGTEGPKVDGKRPKVDGKRLSNHDHAMVLKFQASQVSRMEGPLGRRVWKTLPRTTGNAVVLTYSASDQACAVSIGTRDFGVVWKGLPRRLCYVAISFGNSSKGRVSLKREFT